MRSCEYLKVPQAQDRKTKKLCVRNFLFSLDDKVLNSSSEEILRANKVSITFEDQKNRNKLETVTMYSTNDELLCPVKAWSKTIFRIMKNETSNSDTPINIYITGNKTYEITDKDMIKVLRNAVSEIGKDILGFEASEIGTHSLRSGGAMAMCLASIEPYRIKLIGRWKSDAFMKYIRKQIEEFTQDISNRMIQNEDFRHVRPFIPNQN